MKNIYDANLESKFYDRVIVNLFFYLDTNSCCKPNKGSVEGKN